MGLLYRILILNTLLLLVLGFGPDAKADVCDHLGSTRAVIDETGELLQTVNYYASGVPFTLTQGEVATDRLHSGKQFIDHQGLGYYDNSARMLDVLGGRFTTLDPMATDYGHLSPYTYCAANPLKYTDSSGKYIETLWDVANVTIGIGSFVDNVKQGNVGDAVLDGLGVVVDAAAVILPGVPGGAGAAIKGARAADNVVDAVKSTKAVDKVATTSDTYSITRREAFRKSKETNGIPRSKQPDKTIKPNTPEGKDNNLSEKKNTVLYEFTNSSGEKIKIRQDKATLYKKDGGNQSPHFNAGKKDDNKLKQHHYYETLD